jgi:hypothetical protein
MHPQVVATVQTDLFEHREIKPNFINNCCFGEDFAAWLRQRLSDLSGFEFSDPIQEDYGWGLWARHGNEKFWIALSYVGTGPSVAPAQWVVSVAQALGFNPFKRWLKKPNSPAMVLLSSRVRHELENENKISIVKPAK